MKKFAGHLQYDWWKYVSAMLIPLVLWCSVFSALEKPKANERLHILVLDKGTRMETLEQELTVYLQQEAVQNLKSVRIVTAEYAPENFANQMLAATYSYDIILICREQMTDTVGQDYFFVLPQTLREMGGMLYEETVNGKVLPFGVALENGNYYAFISPQSVNLYPLNEKSGEGDNAAVIAWKWLLENL